jgi:hypothetical protein
MVTTTRLGLDQGLWEKSWRGDAYLSCGGNAVTGLLKEALSWRTLQFAAAQHMLGPHRITAVSPGRAQSWFLFPSLSSITTTLTLAIRDSISFHMSEQLLTHQLHLTRVNSEHISQAACSLIVHALGVLRDSPTAHELRTRSLSVPTIPCEFHSPYSLHQNWICWYTKVTSQEDSKVHLE